MRNAESVSKIHAGTGDVDSAEEVIIRNEGPITDDNNNTTAIKDSEDNQTNPKDNIDFNNGNKETRNTDYLEPLRRGVMSTGIAAPSTLQFNPVTVNLISIYHEYITHKSESRHKNINRMNNQNCCIRAFYIQYLIICELVVAILSVGVSASITSFRAESGDDTCDDTVRLIIVVYMLVLDMLALCCVEVIIVLSCCAVCVVNCLLRAVKTFSFLSYVASVVLLCRVCKSQEGLLLLMMALVLPCSVIVMTTYNAYYLRDFIICNNLDMFQIGCIFIYRACQFFVVRVVSGPTTSTTPDNGSELTLTSSLGTIPAPSGLSVPRPDVENPVISSSETMITVGICGKQLSSVAER
jgi:hypothetical protein